ncbi:hypothetical protein FGSG_13208 [Fusarium graminearum PH-1]|uniref:hypothetical protein n=1 Tax=Gibberella zeae (strain ATCC MYA-4620 / CBS 123657 / FGSC 9075 / NRRL 31084 / PH-1) TaxID=229533 RepID=UPI00021F1E38|nr:hypothetical protein FGSG_13208 [Fusarium graminearum PH-1]ESU14035.1 hypothetical protein FGSG_13208 [Fusarium graminearum PH-1]|eukprot:XP_011327542.1 hypothetical protein FGSG_13208 [Fusarium graminearum PH-1]
MTTTSATQKKGIFPFHAPYLMDESDDMKKHYPFFNLRPPERGRSPAGLTIVKVIYDEDKVTKSPYLADWQNKFPNADVTKWEMNHDRPSTIFIGNKQQEARLSDKVQNKLNEKAAVTIKTKHTPPKTSAKRQRSDSSTSTTKTPKKHKIKAAHQSVHYTTQRPKETTTDLDAITQGSSQSPQTHQRRISNPIHRHREKIQRRADGQVHRSSQQPLRQNHGTGGPKMQSDRTHDKRLRQRHRRDHDRPA